jgi:hypothetical protein
MMLTLLQTPDSVPKPSQHYTFLSYSYSTFAPPSLSSAHNDFTNFLRFEDTPIDARARYKGLTWSPSVYIYISRCL